MKHEILVLVFYFLSRLSGISIMNTISILKLKWPLCKLKAAPPHYLKWRSTLLLLSEKRICALHAVNQFHELRRETVYSGLGARWTVPQIKHSDASFLHYIYTQKLQGSTHPVTMIGCNLHIINICCVVLSSYYACSGEGSSPGPRSFWPVVVIFNIITKAVHFRTP